MPVCQPTPDRQLSTIFGLFLVVMVALTAILALPAQAEAQPEAPHVVTIGVVADNEPYTFFEGRQPTGFSIDVLRLVEKHSNLRFDFRAGSWPDIYAAFLR
ncbi:MAG: hypothetical protein AWU57_5716, partial [Marinobacter sp. T13-3]